MPSIISFGSGAARAYGLTAYSVKGDPYWSNVTILLHCDDTSGSTTVTDSSNNNLTMTNISSLVTNNSTIKKYGACSLYFPGTSNLTNPITATNLIGLNNDFTIEFWFYLPSAQGAWKGLCGNYLDSSYGSRSSWAIGFNGTGSGLSASIATTTNGTYQSTSLGTAVYTVSTGVWYHTAFVRNGNLFTMYVDGVDRGNFTYTGSIYDGGSNLEVGSYINGSYRLTGYIDEFRITKGIARYTSNFTPPTAQFLESGIPPYITSISISSSSGIQNTYVSLGDSVVIKVVFNKNMAVTGSPQLSINVGGTILTASFTSTNLTEVYFSLASMPAGYQDTDGISIDANPINLNSGTIRDLSGTDASLSAAAVLDNISYKVDSIAPTTITLSIDTSTNQATVGSLEANATWEYSVNSGSSWTAGTGTTFIIPSGGYPVNSIQVRQYDYAGNVQTTGIASNTSEFVIYDPSLVSLLMNCDGTSGSTIFLDHSLNKLSLTNGGGSPSLSTATYKYGTTSLYLNGSSSRVTTPNSSVFTFGTGDLTIEFWMYTPIAWTSQSYSAGLFGQKASDSTNGWVIYIDGGWTSKINARLGLQNNFPTGSTPTQNTWEHWALVRSGSSLKWYKNGVLDATTTNSVNLIDSTAPFYIGYSQTWGGYLQAYLDDIRITRQALYTSNFTPPSSKLLLYPDPYYNQVSLLLVGDGANNSSVFTDIGPNPKTIIAAGNAVNSTAFYKYGTSSMYFDGSGDYLYVSTASADFNYGTLNFTIEFWIYPQAGPVSTYNPTFFTNHGDNDWNAAGTGLRIHHQNVLINSSQITFTNAITNNTWTHVAVVRNGNTITAYKNGVNNGSVSYTGYVGSTDRPALATSDSIGSGGREFLQGYIDDLRITKGIARYTGAFTPPTRIGNLSVQEVLNISMTISSGTSITIDQSWLMTNGGWNGSSAANFTITNIGVIQATSTSYSALTFASNLSSLPAGSTLTFVNQGYVVGKGGNGGAGTGQNSPQNGGAGGNAITAYGGPIRINNASGIIGGGGGGGGSGGSWYTGSWGANAHTPGGGGGGGGGFGLGGAGGVWYSSYPQTNSQAGGNGNTTSGSSGGSVGWSSGSENWPYGSNGSNGLSTYSVGSGGGGGLGGTTTTVISGGGGGGGGALGSAGGSGGASAIGTSPGTGGAGGSAVVGNSYITWISTGSRAGSIS